MPIVKPTPRISQFRIGAKHHKNGSTVEASLTVELPGDVPTPDYMTAVKEAQIELRTLLKWTWDEQMKTRESL